jgi:hypothetical protein
VVALALGFKVESSSGAGVDNLFALHDKSVLDEFADEDSGVGLADLFNLVGIHPHAFLSALQDFTGNALLTLQTHHNL